MFPPQRSVILVFLVVVVSVLFAAVARAKFGALLHRQSIDNTDAVLPSDFHDWVYVYQPAATNMASPDRRVAESFPNIYVAPYGYAEYLRSGVFPDGTIAFKQFDLDSLQSASNIAGRNCRICHAPDQEHTADVRIKDTARFGETDGWGYFRFDLSQANNPN